MTRAAGLFGDLPAVRFDLNIVLVTARGEEKRMPEPIRCLGRILADKVCRRVTAIAARNGAMRRLEPAVELLLHDMAVGAGCRVVSKVGPALGVGEGIGANPDGNADKHPEQDALEHARFHLVFRSPTIDDRSLAGKMNCWSPTVLGSNASLHHSITPPLHYSSLPLLPAPAESAVELHQSIELPSASPGQCQLLVKKLLVGDQDL
jgi:hypothetical protein